MKTISDAEFEAHNLLGELGIHVGIENGYLLVNRTSMVQFSNAKGEQAAYDEVLSFLQAEFPGHHVMWGMRNDDDLGLDFYEKKR